MATDLLINDNRSKARNFMVFISLCVLLFCILVRMFLTKSSTSDSKSSKMSESIKETTIVTKMIEQPKIQELQPILNTVENIDITRSISENDNWGIILFVLFCLLLIALCFYLLYLLYKNKHSSVQPEIADGDPIIVLLNDPVASKPKAPVAAPAPVPAPVPVAPSESKQEKYQRATIRVMDTPVIRKYGDLEIKYEPEPITLQYPNETIYDINNAPRQRYVYNSQENRNYAYNTPPQQEDEVYIDNRQAPFDYVDQEPPKRRNVSFYDTYNAYEQKSCAIPPIDYDEIGCSNTRHGERCQCDTCI